MLMKETHVAQFYVHNRSALLSLEYTMVLTAFTPDTRLWWQMHGHRQYSHHNALMCAFLLQFNLLDYCIDAQRVTRAFVIAWHYH